HLRRGKGMKVTDAGFDQYSLFHAWHTEEKGSRYAGPTVFENGELLQHLTGEYGPDHWVDFITDFVDREKDEDNPFFIYYAMALPHRPFVPTPASRDWNKGASRDEEDTRHFPDMVAYMDRCVGRVMQHIDDSGLGRDTLIIFYSDNGTHQKITSQTVNGPVTGGKGRTTDAGTHVPLIVRWTGKIKPGVNDNLVDSTDFLPTLLEAAGQSPPTDLDGISFYPQLFGRRGMTRPWVFCHYDPRPGWDKDQFRKIRFARDKRFKLYGDGALHDIPSDKLEQNPIAREDDSEASREARERLSSVLDAMPNPDPEPRDGDLTSADQRLYVAVADQLVVFAIDSASGRLEEKQRVPLKAAGPFTFAPNRKWMYAVSESVTETEKAAIATLEVKPGGELRVVQQAVVDHRPGFLMTDNNGEFLAGSHYREGKATVWQVDPVYHGKTIAELELERQTHSAVFSPDSRFLLIPATGPNKIFIRKFMAQVGTTELHEPPFVNGPSGTSDAKQPRHLIFHPHLSVAYTTNERQLPGVGVWRWDAESGVLQAMQNVVTLPPGFEGTMTTADLHLTPDARFLYVSNRDVSERNAATGSDSIIAFRVDAQTGTLDRIGDTPCERIPRSFTIDKLGKYLYVAGQGDGKLGVYRIESEGQLTKVAQYAVGRRPVWIETLALPTIVPDHTVDASEDAVSQFGFRPLRQDELVPKSSKLELLWGDGEFTEGPTIAKDGSVLFTDVRRNRIMKFDPRTQTTSVFREESGSANGLVHDRVGRLIACEGADGGRRRLSITQLDGSVETLVDRWEGKRLNSPNDVTIAPDGTVYFTDPRYRGLEKRDIDFEGVYFIRDGKAVLATDEVERPNGIVISADGTHAFVADNHNAEGGARKLYRFSIRSDGKLTNRLELYSFRPDQRGIDGMTIDRKGNVYATAGKGDAAGVYVFGPDGQQLARIAVPDLPTNCTFGGPEAPHMLYVTAQTAANPIGPPRFGLFRIRLTHQGLTTPPTPIHDDSR
ncbi:MAG: beta-propeller fold lactonase family protein, partial [Planctomycetota bacterium]